MLEPLLSPFLLFFFSPRERPQSSTVPLDTPTVPLTTFKCDTVLLAAARRLDSGFLTGPPPTIMQRPATVNLGLSLNSQPRRLSRSPKRGMTVPVESYASCGQHWMRSPRQRCHAFQEKRARTLQAGFIRRRLGLTLTSRDAVEHRARRPCQLSRRMHRRMQSCRPKYPQLLILAAIDAPPDTDHQHISRRERAWWKKGRREEAGLIVSPRSTPAVPPWPMSRSWPVGGPGAGHGFAHLAATDAVTMRPNCRPRTSPGPFF